MVGKSLAVLLFCLSAVAQVDEIRGISERGRQGGRLARAEVVRRGELLKALIQRDPASAFSLMLPVEDQETWRAAYPDANNWIERSGVWTGRLTASVEDDFDGGRSREVRRFESEGATWTVAWHGPTPAARGCDEVKITGFAVGDQMLATDGVVSRAGTSCSTVGDQKALVLLLNFASRKLPGWVTASSMAAPFFGAASSLSTTLSEYSYGQTTVSGEVRGPFELPGDYLCDQSSQIESEALTAADSAVDFRNYSRIYFVFPKPDGCSYGGLGSIGCWTLSSPLRGTFTASVTWLPAAVNGNPEWMLSTIVHETGHNLGLGHARTLDYGATALAVPGAAGTYQEYGDPFSNMGSGKGHWAAEHKDMLKWFPAAANIQQVSAATTALVRPMETASTASQALRIRRAAGLDQWLWVEFRQATGSDANIPAAAFTGATIRLEDASTGAGDLKTALLDFTPVATPNNFNDAPLAAGRQWLDPYSTLSLTIGSAKAAGLDVTVGYDSACATLTPGSQTVGPAAWAGSIAVVGPATCNWQAVSTADWVTITSGSSGTGSGTVSYAVTANTTSNERRATLYVARQAFEVAQMPQPQASSVSPSSGTGNNATFTAVFRDSYDYRNLQWTDVSIAATTGTASACYVRWDTAQARFLLRNDADNGWIGPAEAGGPAVLENTQCTLSAGASSATGSGPALTLALALTFRANYQGSKSIYMQTRTAGIATGWQTRGSWTVPAEISIPSVTPGSGSGMAQVFTMKLNAPGGIPSLSSAYLKFGDESNVEANVCTVLVRRTATGATIGVFNDAGTSATLVAIGSTSPRENSQCAVQPASSSSAGTGNDWTVAIAVTFKTAFTGQRRIWARAQGSMYTAWAEKGRWTVAPSVQAKSVTPSSGSGATQVFRAVYSGSSSYQELSTAEMNVNASTATANACWVRYDRAAGTLSLRNDADSAWLGPVTPGSGSQVENAQCTLKGTGSAANGAGSDLTVDVALGLKTAFQGAKNLYMQAHAAGVPTGWTALGTWTVPGSGCTYSVNPSSVSPAAAGGAGSVAVTAGVGCAWTAASGVSWMTVTGGASGSGNGTVNYTVASNTATSSRSGALTVAGRTVTVTQAGAAPPSMSLSRKTLAFASAKGGTVGTQPQQVVVTFAGGAAPAWTVTSDRSWLTVSPASGTGSGSFEVRANAAAMGGPAALTVTAAGASNSPQTIAVTTTALAQGAAKPPFGSFDTPADGITGVAGNIAVTGWALDDVGVERVTIWRDPVGPEPSYSNGLVYIADGLFISDARPDVAGTFGSTPVNYKAGWGYMMLTNFLPATAGGASGNGTYRLHAYAVDKEGNQTYLGSKRITVDNAHAVKPFGTIDTPGQGATVNGTAYVNFGWALTPQPNKIAESGSTIQVGIDGVLIGSPVYNQNRSDIAGAFPGYANSNGAVGYYYLDTSKYANGVHTIGWLVRDDGGRADGVGSRFFSVLNAGGSAAAQSGDSMKQELVRAARARRRAAGPAVASYSVGYDAADLRPVGAEGIELRELDRVEIHLPAGEGGLWSAGVLVNGEAGPLPPGTTFDDEAGTLYWQLGPGIMGRYELEFRREGTAAVRVEVQVK